ncbi:MAG: DUF1016 domain-containing protein [Deltaproteobacteria bacterium]|nr:DUF1016 domain-containing protein [Deltaproteobacteria bacterium]
MSGRRRTELYKRIRQILESARGVAVRSVNTAQVIANWLVGREIVEEEQRGRKKAIYGQKLIVELSKKLQKDFGSGYSATNLKLFRQFFLEYPDLLRGRIGHTLRDQSLPECETSVSAIITFPTGIGRTSCDQSWKSGLLHPNLSWSLYRHLVGVESTLARSFYEIEAIRNN